MICADERVDTSKFSNSFITHEEKTKETATATVFGEVILIIIKVGESLLSISPRIVYGLRSYIKQSKDCLVSEYVEIG